MLTIAIIWEGLVSAVGLRDGNIVGIRDLGQQLVQVVHISDITSLHAVVLQHWVHLSLVVVTSVHYNMYWERPIDIKRHNICTLQHVVGESCGTNQLAIVLALDSSVGAAPSVNNSLNCLVFVYIYLPCIHTILHINSDYTLVRSWETVIWTQCNQRMFRLLKCFSYMSYRVTIINSWNFLPFACMIIYTTELYFMQLLYIHKQYITTYGIDQ